MAGIFEITEIEARKRALRAEAEIYRHTLKLEIQNLRLYGVQLRRRLDVFRPWRPLLAATPLLVTLYKLSVLGGRRREKKTRGRLSRLLGGVLFGWRLFRSYGPLVQGLIAQTRRRGSYTQARQPSGIPDVE